MKPVLVLILAVMFASALPAQEASRQGGADKHMLNFQDADIRSLITTVADITGRNIVIDPAVSGRVTVVSSEALDPDAVYAVFRSILQVHGYSAITDGQGAGAVTRIVPDASARFDAGSQGGAGTNGSIDRQDYITRVITLDHVRVAEVVPMLRSLVPQSAFLSAHEPSNSILISDRAASVRRVEKVISRLDAATDDALEVISLSHASATEVVEIANQVYADSGRAPAIADERTNSVILTGDSGMRVRLRTLISHLDTPLDAGGSARVIYLRYANAESLVPVLESLVGDGGDEEGRREVSIKAHSETNAVVISATPAVQRELRSIIDQLDIRRAQVQVEAIIAEVAVDTGRDLGIQWQFFDSGDSGVFGGTNFGNGGNNILNLSAGLAAGENGDGPGVLPGGGLNLGYVGGTTDLLGVELLEIGALVRALATDGNTNVLSTPSIVTMDNQQASINVGQEVPFLSGSFQTQGVSTSDGQVNPFQTIQREEVGLKLNVTPHINEGDTIMLDIDQEVSSLAPISGAVDLITNKRTISTRVMVPDGAMLVLGGLISDDLSETTERVPGLSRIPLLGELFTSRSTTKVKRNLMVFIRPRILDDAGAMDAATRAKYSTIRNAQLRQQQRDAVLLEREDRPLLPELDDFLQTGASAGRPGSDSNDRTDAPPDGD